MWKEILSRLLRNRLSIKEGSLLVLFVCHIKEISQITPPITPTHQGLFNNTNSVVS